MIIKIKLSNKLTHELQKENIKAVDVINHILDTNTSIKTNITERYNTAAKDLYIIDNDKKYYCFQCVIDTLLNELQLSF